MQRKEFNSDSEEDTSDRKTGEYHRFPYTTGKRLKRSESEEDLDYHSDTSQKKRDLAKTVRHQRFQKNITQPWLVSPSCTRLHSIDECIKELESLELKQESLRRLIQDQTERKKQILHQLSDLTNTQLQEQLSHHLSKIQAQLSIPKSGILDASYSQPCLDCCKRAIGPGDTVEVETPFHCEDSFEIGKVIQTVEDNIVLVKLRSTDKVLGTFGSKLRLIEDI